MTKEAHDTNLILIVFLDLKKKGIFYDNILSHEITDPYLKKYTFSDRLV